MKLNTAYNFELLLLPIIKIYIILLKPWPNTNSIYMKLAWIMVTIIIWSAKYMI